MGVGRIKLCQFNSCKKHDSFCTYVFYLIALVRTLRTIFNIPNFSGNTSKFYLTMVPTAFFSGNSMAINVRCKIFGSAPASLLLVALACNALPEVGTLNKVTNGLSLPPALASAMKVIVRLYGDIFKFDFQASKKPGAIVLFFVVLYLQYLANVPSFLNCQHCYVSCL